MLKSTWLIGAPITVIALAGATLLGLRWFDSHADSRAWRDLTRQSGTTAGVFTPDLLEGLPEPARRYFTYSIAPGTRLSTIVEIHMQGELGLGDKEAPKYAPMEAHQILAPPYGLVWKVRSGAITGSDAITPKTSWTRFWLFNAAPIVRAGGPDHHRSAFGRVVAEGAFWAPASLLPGEHVRWEPINNTAARAIVTFGSFEQAVEITVAADGRPEKVVIQRWSNENADRIFRAQPFGGVLSDFKEFDGYMLPTRVEGGNHFGSDDYFPFYKVSVTGIRML